MDPCDLGERICVMGPSNSGKSTLADALGRRFGFATIHLDRLHHRPDGYWQARPFAEFAALHEEAIAQDRWVIDGSYTKLVARRLERATGLILLDVPTHVSLWRYLRRTISAEPRIGGLEGARDRITGEMLHHIIFVTPGTRRRNARIFDACGLPKIRLGSLREIRAVYDDWALRLP